MPHLLGKPGQHFLDAWAEVSLSFAVSGGGSAVTRLRGAPGAPPSLPRSGRPGSVVASSLPPVGHSWSTSSRAQMPCLNARGCECSGTARTCQREALMDTLGPPGWVRVGRLHAARVQRRAWPSVGEDTPVSRMPWRLLACRAGSPRRYGGGKSEVSSLPWHGNTCR
jgi:hypothetical protein